MAWRWCHLSTSAPPALSVRRVLSPLTGAAAATSRSGTETTARPRAPVGICRPSRSKETRLAVPSAGSTMRDAMRHQESRGGNQIDIDFTRASVKDLHSRVLVAVHKIGLISKKIQDVRDKYLQPQLDELIGCFTRMWATMLECHQCQCAIIKLASRSCDLKISFQSESQHQAGFLLSVELRKLCSNFQNWMASQKVYLCSLNLWLHKCMKPLKRRKVSRNRNAVDASLKRQGRKGDDLEKKRLNTSSSY